MHLSFFHVCRYTPKFQIEQHRWKYFEKGKLANEKVKLLMVKGAKYTLKKEGKIVMPLTLKPHEHKEIEVLFELSYDKDLKVSY